MGQAMSSQDPSPTFEKQVSDAFHFLFEEFRFHRVSSGAVPPEWYVILQNETTAVTVNFETGVGPWIMLSSLLSPKAGFDLTFLLQERGSGPVDRSRCREIDDPIVPLCLRELAKRLRIHAKDVLNGDFTIFPKLEIRAAENARRADLDSGSTS
jgi:hypothetical protein